MGIVVPDTGDTTPESGDTNSGSGITPPESGDANPDEGIAVLVAILAAVQQARMQGRKHK